MKTKLARYEQMIRDGRSTCPSFMGEDLKLWETARRNVGRTPRTGVKCSCRLGQQRDNCPQCEGTGWVIDFAAIRKGGAK